MSPIGEQLTAKYYVDEVISNRVDELSLIRIDQDNDFNNFNLTKRNSITLKTQAVSDNHVITKAYVDHFHTDNERNRRDLGIDFFNESSELVKNNQDNNFNDNTLSNFYIVFHLIEIQL